MENLNVGIGFVYGALIIAIYKIWYMINFWISVDLQNRIHGV
jgi:hypothetical protein